MESIIECIVEIIQGELKIQGHQNISEEINFKTDLEEEF